MQPTAVRLMHLLAVLAAAAFAVPAAAQSFYRGELVSFFPSDFLVGATSNAEVRMNNTGVSAYFEAEIVSVAGGWTITPTVTSRAIVANGKTGKFTFQVTVPANEPPGTDRQVRVRLFVYQDDIIRTQVDDKTYTIRASFPPQPFDTFQPEHLSGGHALPINFGWTGSIYAQTYRIEFFADNAGAPVLPPFYKVEGLTVNEFRLTSDIVIGGQNLRLPPGQPVHWLVTAVNALGERQNTGGDRIFITLARDPLTPFQFVQPAQSNLVLPPNPTIEWTASQNAVLYVLQVFNAVDGRPVAPPVFEEQLLGATRLDWGGRPGLAPGNYFVYVGAFNENWNQPIDGGPRPFSVTNLGAFNLLSPAADQTAVSDMPLFQWQHALGAQEYTLDLVLETPGAFHPVASLVTPGAATSHQWTGTPLVRGLTYWWQVTAKKGTERRLNTGGPRKFTVQPLGAFSALSPVAGATGVPRRPTFDWQGSAGAKNYVVEIAPSNQGVPDTGNLRTSGSLSPTTLRWTATFAELDGGADYFWRVRALDPAVPAVEINREGWQAFRTTSLVPFALRAPANGATGVSLTPTFEWDPVTGALFYRVLVTAPVLGTLPPLATAGNVGTLTVPAAATLNGDTTYSWTVEAVGPDGTQLAGQTFGFTTASRNQATRADVLAAILGRQILSAAERAAYGIPPADAISIATILPVTN